jgi:hypothetical protein
MDNGCIHRWTIGLSPENEHTGQGCQRVSLHYGGVVIKQPVWNCVSRMPSVKLDMNDELTPQTLHAKKAIYDFFSGM